MLDTYEQRSKTKLAATVVTILVIAGLVVLADRIQSAQKDNTATAQPATVSTSAASSAANGSDTTNTTSTSSSETTSTDASSGYKDGSYSVSSSYTVPPGRESIQVNLTIANGVVTSASVQNSENDFDSAQYQEEFAAEYKSQVVGKKISGLQIRIVAGASETTGGFNSALSKIASQAQA